MNVRIGSMPNKKSKVLFLKGLPASGKSTWAREWVSEDPTNRVRVNKDDLRSLLHSGKYSEGNEKQVVRIEEQIIIDCVRNGKDVVVDNTHLATSKEGANIHLCRIQNVISGYGFENFVEYEVKEFDIEPEEAVKRDLTRPNSVGQDVIWSMYWNHVAKTEAVEYNDKLPDCIIADIDGSFKI
jgi:predicted kinase